jgi:hypothetical protein
VSHAVSTLSGAQHDSARRTSAATQRSISRKTQRPQSKLIPTLAFLAPWREEIRSQSSNNKCVHLRGTPLIVPGTTVEDTTEIEPAALTTTVAKIACFRTMRARSCEFMIMSGPT